MSTHEVTVQHALIRYSNPDDPRERRFAFRGQKVTLSDKDFKHLDAHGAFTPPPTAPTTGTTPPKAYDEMTVAEAIEFLEGLEAEQREEFFAQERDKERKGVLAHFDQD